MGKCTIFAGKIQYNQFLLFDPCQNLNLPPYEFMTGLSERYHILYACVCNSVFV